MSLPSSTLAGVQSTPPGGARNCPKSCLNLLCFAAARCSAFLLPPLLPLPPVAPPAVRCDGALRFAIGRTPLRFGRNRTRATPRGAPGPPRSFLASSLDSWRTVEAEEEASWSVASCLGKGVRWDEDEMGWGGMRRKMLFPACNELAMQMGDAEERTECRWVLSRLEPTKGKPGWALRSVTNLPLLHTL